MAGDEAKEAFLVLEGALGTNRQNVEVSVCGNKTPPPTRNLSADAATRSGVTAAPEAGQEKNGAQRLVHQLTIAWRRAGVLPFGVYRAQIAQVQRKLYLGGGDTLGHYNIVQEYDTSTHTWSQLPECLVERAALAEVNRQLVLAGSHHNDEVIGGAYSHTDNNTMITVWDGSDWFQPHPPMDTGRSYGAAVSYRDYLVVACGLAGEEEVATVEVLDCAERSWHRACPVPIAGHHMSSAVIDNHWYLLAHYWKDSKPHVFSTYLPTLASSTADTGNRCPNTWVELAGPPVKDSILLAYESHLLLLGGLKKDFQKSIHCYDPTTNRWKNCGSLPARMNGCSCAQLPSGELLVTGGYVKGNEGHYSRDVWIGNVTH